MLIVQFLMAVAICLWLQMLWTRRKYYRLIFQIPGPIGFPLLGMAHKLMKREGILYMFEKYEKQYGSVFFSWLGPLPFLVVCEPQIAKDILTSPHCIDKALNYNAIADGTGPGLFSLKNPAWSKHRKLLNPAFGHKVLLSFVPIFNEEINGLLKSVDALAGMGAVDLTPVFQKFTLTTAIRTTMGTLDEKKDSSQHERLLDSYACVLEILTEMCFAPWLNNGSVRWLLRKERTYRSAKKQIHDYIRNLIHKKLEDDANNVAGDAEEAQHKNVFINLAIDLLKKGSLTAQNVEDESNVIVFGAFETTANTISYTLMLLSMYPQYQKKAYEEIVSIFPERGTFEVSYADTRQMVYMDMILKEAMRVIAPVPLIARQTSQELQLSNGWVLPKGVQIVIDIFHMHRRTDIWGPAAHSFDPEHFLPSNMQSKHPYGYIPFTKGIRDCIGSQYALLSAKTALAKLLRNYSFTTSFNISDLHFVEDVTLKFKNTPLIEVQPRSA